MVVDKYKIDITKVNSLEEFAHECYVQHFNRVYLRNKYLIGFLVTSINNALTDEKKSALESDVVNIVVHLVDAFYYYPVEKKYKFLVYDLKNGDVQLLENYEEFSPLDSKWIIGISTINRKGLVEQILNNIKEREKKK